MKDTGTYIHTENRHLYEGHGLLVNLWRFRFALENLLLKDFRIRYRNMSLGILWSLLNPLVMLGVLVVVFSFIHPQRHSQFFTIFLLLGMTCFNFFSQCLAPTTNSIIENAALIKKVIFPREMVPIAVVLSQVIHILIQLLLLAVFLLIFSVPLKWTWLWLPVIYLVELIFILGAGFICSTMNVFYRDVLYLVQSSLTVMFWLTPVFYDLAQVKLNIPYSLYLIYILNPLAGCIDASRRVILQGLPPNTDAFFIAILVSIATLFLGLKLFNNKKRYFADKI